MDILCACARAVNGTLTYTGRGPECYLAACSQPLFYMGPWSGLPGSQPSKQLETLSPASQTGTGIAMKATLPEVRHWAAVAAIAAPQKSALRAVFKGSPL